MQVKDFTSLDFTPMRAYRFPAVDSGDPDAWLPLHTALANVARSPLANDSLHRLYWTESDGSGAFWSTYDDIIAGNPPYTLGFIAPDAGYEPGVTATGGTDPTVVPYVARSYIVTFIDSFGSESSPSLPSDVVSGASDGDWTIDLRQFLPGQPAGKNYPLPVKMRLYRTVTAQTTGAAFYQVAEWVMASSPPPITGYIDTSLDTTIVNNVILETASWVSPPEDLDGLIGFPGGMLIGFTGNTLHFCEPDRPHAWPAGYDQSVQYKIVGLGVWQQSVMIMTEGPPSQATGSAPANFTTTQLRVPEPCISRGSILTDMNGVYYASQNGIISLNYYGMKNNTAGLVVKNDWLNEFHADALIACRHREQFLAINDTGVGFIVDYSEMKSGVESLNTFNNAVCVWNDESTGDTFIMADKIVYRWDDKDSDQITYRWRSKLFYLPEPENIGACQIHADASILTTTTPDDPPPLDNADATLDLPDDVNCVFRFYADGVLRLERNILTPTDIFRLPSGFLAFEFQFEIVSRVPVFSIQLASTMKDLRKI